MEDKTSNIPRLRIQVVELQGVFGVVDGDTHVVEPDVT